MEDTLIEIARSHHTGSDRGYHGWSHPLALLNHFEAVKQLLHDPVAVECAILFHDAIYDPMRTDNEARSAQLASEVLADRIPEPSLARTVRLIEATALHRIPDNLSPDDAHDTAIFLDLDLSILGASDEVFDAYERGVRHEYQHVPEAAFRAGRAAILENFLSRDRLFLSDWGYERFEDRARLNLRRSIAALQTA